MMMNHSSSIFRKVSRRTLATTHHRYQCQLGSKEASTYCSQHRRSFSAAPVTTAGEEAYRRYLDTLKQLKKFREDQELAKSEKLFDAWRQSQENSDSKQTVNKKKAAGVAVVRTLAKHSNAATRTSVEQQEAVLQEQANSQLKLSAEKFRYPAALVQLANNLLLLKEIDQKQVETALDYYRAAGEQGSSEGWFNLGHCLWNGIDSIVAPNHDEAMEAFHKAIALGDCDAMYFVGVQYLGLDDDTDDTQQLRQALQWIEQAADSDHGGALHYLTVFHLNGYAPLQIPPSTEQDFARRLDAAICHDDTGEAHFLRGSCYYTGDCGYPQDTVKALFDFLVAADLGHADAAVSAGAILHTGVPGLIPQDQQRAFALYQNAGELGNSDGWRNVVACYATGEGVKQSMETAKYIAKTMLGEEKKIST